MTQPPPDSAAGPTLHRPSVPELFLGFLQLGLMGFGGVLPLARRLIVEERRWLSEQEFAEYLGLCQFLPGGNIINLSVALGLEFQGVAGAVAGLLGIIAAPTAVVVALGAAYAHFQNDPRLIQLFAGLAAAASSLIIVTAWRMLRPLLNRPWLVAVSLVCFGAVALLRLPLLPTMLVLAPLGILVSWRTGTRRGA